jgi:DNA-binding PucR family transcriptional regulator
MATQTQEGSMTGQECTPAALAALVDRLQPKRAPAAASDGEPNASGGSNAEAWAAEVAESTTNLIAEANEDVRDLRLAEIRRAGEDMLVRILRGLSGGVADVRLTAEQNEIVHDSAAREIPFDRIVAALRLAQSHWTDVLLDEVGATGHWAMARTVVRAIARQVDAAVDASIREYLNERERLLASAEARRRELVEALVSGHAVDPQECRTRLGLELAHEHVAMVIHGASGHLATSTGADLAHTAGRAARAVGAQTSVVHQPSPDTVWLWASHPHSLSLDGLTALEPSVRKLGQRLAAGAPRVGAAGVRRSHRDAQVADRLPLPDDGGPSVVRYTDVDLAALLAADLAQARCFVRDHLGGLAENRPEIGELRETLSHYYRANMSLLAAATPLHVHRNTVVYRLRRIEQILGHPVSEGALEIRCALLLVERFGTGALAEDAG